MKSTSEFVSGALVTLQRNKNWAEQAIQQTSNENMHKPITADTNSIVVIMKHISGNLKSRWTDFLTTDGEKEWRDRDNEFVDDFTSREQLMAVWNEGWDCFVDSLENLTDEDLTKTIKIRGEDHSVPLAIQRSLTHTTYHVGQIMLIARALFDGEEWQTISIPKGKSAEYNETVWGKGHYQK